MKNIILFAILFLIGFWSQSQEQLVSIPQSVTISQTSVSTGELAIPNLTIIPNVDPKFEDGLDALETVSIRLEIKNEGDPGKNLKLKAQLKEDSPTIKITFDSDPFALNHNDFVEKEIILSGTKELFEGENQLIIKVTEPNGNDRTKKITFSTHPFKEPKLDFDHVIASINGSIVLGEKAFVKIQMSNNGPGNAKNVKMSLSFPDSLVKPTGTFSFDYDVIRSGESITEEIGFFINNQYTKKIVSLPLTIIESTGDYGKEGLITFNTDEKTKSTDELVFRSKRVATSLPDKPDRLLSEVDQPDNIPNSRKKKPNAFAVVIGNRDYEKFAPVEYAIRDAYMMKEYLIKSMGYDPSKIIYRRNADLSSFNELFGTSEATGTIEKKINSYKKLGEEVDELFIYYSGHGTPDPSDNNKAYFLGANSRPNATQTTAYSADLFYKNINKLKVKNIFVVLDACFSGQKTSAQNKSGVGVIPIVSTAIDNGILLASSSDDQYSNWNKEEKHGLFTYFFLEGISNMKADKNNDNKITWKEIEKHVRDGLSRATINNKYSEQEPNLSDPNNKGELSIVER